MQITRWVALVPTIAMSAACAAGGRAPGGDPLEQDVALAALGQSDRAVRPLWLAGAVVCQPAAVPARPTETQQARAAQLLELGKGTALIGNTQGATDLLRQAAYLDGTSPVAAYHLARASEMAGDTAMAVREYCRYLSLGTSASERAEVRERLLLLAPAGGAPASTARASAASSHGRVARVVPRRIARPATAPARTTSGGVGRPVPSARAEDGGAYGGTYGGTYGGQSDGAVAVGTDGVAVADGAATPRAPSPPAEPARRTVRDAAIGAVVGAAAGAVVSRDVKGAVLGAATGGLLGAVLGRSAEKTGRP